MLLGSGRRLQDTEGGLDSIHNYYERLVVEEIHRSNERSQSDHDFLADVACVALNRLPPRYIRYDVDMTFFMSTQEMDEVHNKVRRAVREAIDYVLQREVERSQTSGAN